MLLRHPQAAADDGPVQSIRTPTIQERLQDLQARARRGDRRAIAELRALLDAHPKLWRAASDLARPAINAWLALAAPNDLLVREALQRRMDELRRELLGDDRRPLVALQVEQVVVSFAQVQAGHFLVAEAVRHGGKLAEQMNRQLAAAERQYQRALKQLLEVQRRLPQAAPKAATAVSADTSPTLPAATQASEQSSHAMPPTSPTAAQQHTAAASLDTTELPTTPPTPYDATAPTVLPSEPPDRIDHDLYDDRLPDDTEEDDMGADDGNWETTDAQIAELARKVAEGPSYEYHLAQQVPGDIALRFRPQQGPENR